MVVEGETETRVHLRSEKQGHRARQVRLSLVEPLDGPRVLFLDIDGVLNDSKLTAQCKRDGLDGTEHFNPESVVLLNKIVIDTGAVVVVSASIRKLCTVKELQALFSRNGFQGKVVDKTPSLGGVRGDEIQAWLDLNPCSSYVIVDDSNDMAHLHHRLVHVRHGYANGGLLKSHYHEIRRLFGLDYRPL